MKKSNTGRYAIVGATAIALAGCLGGSGSDSGSGSGGDNNASLGSLTEVESTVMSSSEGGMTYTEATQKPASSCGARASDRYLETSRTRVFGDTNVSQDRLQVIANGVHHYYDQALSKMGIDAESFNNSRLHAVANAYIAQDIDTPDWEYTQQALNEEVGLSGTVENSTDAMRELLKLTPQELDQVIGKAFMLSGISRDDRMFYFGGIDGDKRLSYRYEAPKIVVCVDSSVDPSNGTGLFSGITVGTDPRPDIVAHELVHYIQNRLIGGNAYTHAPRWFTEGQAVVLSEQSIAGESDLGSFNPIMIELFADEGDKDMGLAYRLYGLAYQYASEETSSQAMNNILKNSFASNLESESLGDFERFKNAFSARVNDPSGNDLGYVQYKDTWESRALNYLQ